VIIVTFVIGLWLVLRRFLQRMRRRSQRLAALTVIENADDWQAIRQGLKLYASAQGWPSNTPLSQWVCHWQKSYAMDASLAQTLTDLSLACYQQHCTYTPEQLRKNLLPRLYYPAPVLR
jgi:hypothetical protein